MLQSNAARRSHAVPLLLPVSPLNIGAGLINGNGRMDSGVPGKTTRYTSLYWK